MGQIIVYQSGPKDNYGYDIINDEGTVIMTGDGYESIKEIYDWLGELCSVLLSSNVLPDLKK